MTKKSGKKHTAPRPQTGNFDGIANKFDQNIYGTSKGRLRHALLCHHLDAFIRDIPGSGVSSPDDEKRSKLRVLDVGGGTGVMSLELVKAGYDVTLLDSSEEALAIAKTRLQDYSNTQFIHASLEPKKDENIQSAWEALAGQNFDLIICHALLEWLKNAFAVLDALIEKLSDSGTLSLSFFNHDAMLFNNALYGNFHYIAKGMKTRNVVRLNPHNPQVPKSVLAHLMTHKTLNITKRAGIRCFHDYMRDVSMQESAFDDLLKLELQYSAKEPYLWLGKYFYIQATKNAE